MDSMSPKASIALRMLFICKLTIKLTTAEPHSDWVLSQKTTGRNKVTGDINVCRHVNTGSYHTLFYINLFFGKKKEWKIRRWKTQ